LKSVRDFLFRLRAISVLQLLKRYYTYRVLSEITNVDAPTLNRYVKRVLMPTLKRARNMVDILEKKRDPTREIVKCILKYKGRDAIKMLFANRPELVGWMLDRICEEISRKDIDIFLCTSDGGFALSSVLAAILGKKVIVAERGAPKTPEVVRERTRVPYKDLIERISYLHMLPLEPEEELYIPNEYIREVGKNVRTVIITDMMWTGSTFYTLVSLAKKIGMEIRHGVVAIVAIEKIIERMRRDVEFPISYLIALDRYEEFREYVEDLQKGVL